MGPLVDQQAATSFFEAIEKVREGRRRILYGGVPSEISEKASLCYVVPCIAEVKNDTPLSRKRPLPPCFIWSDTVPWMKPCKLHNAVPQGLSSAMFSTNLMETEQFLSHCGSDCGIANINIGTSGAEIGGAFGGKRTPVAGGNQGLIMESVYAKTDQYH